MQFVILCLDLLRHFLHFLIECLLVAQISTLVLGDLISFGLNFLVFLNCILSRSLGIFELPLKSVKLIATHMSTGFHFIVPARLELFDYLFEFFNLLSHLFIPLFEFPDQFLEVSTVNIRGIARLTHAKEFLDLHHLAGQSVVLLVQVIVLVLQRLHLGLPLLAIVLLLDLLEGLPSLVEHAQARDLLVTHVQTVLEILQTRF